MAPGMAPTSTLPRLATLSGAGGGCLPSRSQAASPTREIGEIGEMFGAAAEGDPMATVWSTATAAWTDAPPLPPPPPRPPLPPAAVLRTADAASSFKSRREPPKARRRAISPVPVRFGGGPPLGHLPTRSMLASRSAPLLALSPYKRPLKQLGPDNHMLAGGGVAARPGRDGLAATARERERAAFGGGSGGGDWRVRGTTSSRGVTHSVPKLTTAAGGGGGGGGGSGGGEADMYHPWYGEAARVPEMWSRGATAGGRRRGSPPACELDPRADAGPDGAAISPPAAWGR